MQVGAERVTMDADWRRMARPRKVVLALKKTQEEHRTIEGPRSKGGEWERRPQTRVKK